MPSLHKFSTAGMAFLFSFLPLFLLLLLGSADVLGASFREHRLRSGESDPRRGTPRLPPNADMLKALEYIESLRQQTGAAALEEQPPLPPDYDGTGAEDTETLRSMLRLASQAQSQAGRDQDEEEEDEEEGDEEDKTQEWLRAVLSTLEQGETMPEPAPVRPSAGRHPLTWKRQRSVQEDEEESQAGGGGEVYRHAGQPHRKYSLLFEDAEGSEGEKDEAQRSSSPESPFFKRTDDESPFKRTDDESPFKRTNEDMEEKYTPQNLANLQSVFEELGRLANGKTAGHRRQATAEDEDEDEDTDMFTARGPDYDDDVTGGEDWTPVEQIQAEEEEGEKREETERGLEDDDVIEYDDDDDDDDEEGEDNRQVKRSTPPGLGENHQQDDITKLVDYYLLKVLEKTEEEEQKRELDEEEEEEEQRAERRRAAQSQHGDIIDPRAVYQLIRISQKLQVPEEDLLDMLKTAEVTKHDRTSQRNRAQTRMPTPAKIYNRWLPETQTSDIPKEMNTEDILNILGLGSVGNRKAATVPLRQKQQQPWQSQFYAPAGRQRGSSVALSQVRVPDKSKADYDDNIGDKDELATYLAARMLVRYPVAVNNRADQKRASQPPPPRDEQSSVSGGFEQAIQDYFDQMDSDKKSSPQKRELENDVADQTQPLDDEVLLKMLSLLNPESDVESEEDGHSKSGM